MCPVFERADKAELEAAAEELWHSVEEDGEKVVAKVVKGNGKSEPETSAAEVETK